MSDLNLPLLLPLLVTSLVAVAGWFAAHSFTARRERAAKRRDLQTQYLIEAYRKLERAAHRNPPLPSDAGNLETAIADIHLFGSSEHIRLARTFVTEFAEQHRGDISDLLISLRTDLRRELELPAVPSKVAFLRVHRDSKDPDGA